MSRGDCAAASIYLVAQPDYDSDNIDSAWTTEDAALARAAELGRAFVSEYRADAGDGWIRNGWAPAGDKPVWSDWGGSGLEETAAVGQTAVSGSAHVVREPERAAVSSNPDDKEESYVVRISSQRGVLMGGSRAVPSDLESAGRTAVGVAGDESAEAVVRPDVRSAAKPLLCRAGLHGRLEVLRSMLWFDLVRCVGCGKRGYKVRRG